MRLSPWPLGKRKREGEATYRPLPIARVPRVQHFLAEQLRPGLKWVSWEVNNQVMHYQPLWWECSEELKETNNYSGEAWELPSTEHITQQRGPLSPSTTVSL